MVAEIEAFGLPVQIHCNGDYTIDIALDAIAKSAEITDSGKWALSNQRFLSPYCLPRSQRLPYHQNRPQ